MKNAPRNLHQPKKSFNALRFAAAFVAGITAMTAEAAPLYHVDTLLTSLLLKDSSAADELAAIEQASGRFDLQLDFESSKNIALLNPGSIDQWFIDVAPTTPGYFLLKFGIGSTSADANTFLFENINELTKLVWSNSQVQFLTGGDCSAGNDSACNIQRLSHYATYDPDAGRVPEPGSLAIMGLGLMGLTVAGRYVPRKKIERKER